MIKRKTVIVIAGIAIAIVAIASISVTIFYYSKFSQKHGVVINIPSDDVDLDVKNFHYTEVGGKDSKWEINADRAKYIKKKSIAEFNKVCVTIIFTNGRKYTINGDHGRFHTDTKDIELSGNIIIESEKGETLQTEHLTYSDIQKVVTTDDPVVITSEKISLNGVGLRYNLKIGFLNIKSQVTAFIKSR